jgi:hypothetical protein
MRPDMNARFDKYNQRFFGGTITKIPVVMNGRLQTAAGKCWATAKGKVVTPRNRGPLNPFAPEPKARRVRWWHPDRIELHSRLFDDIGWDWTRAGWSFPEGDLTLIHEMVHAYLMEHFNDDSHRRKSRRDGIRRGRFQDVMNRITGVHTDHTYHYMNVSKWRRMPDGMRRQPQKKTALVKPINPFAK